MQELLEWHRKSMRSYSETNKMIEALLEKEKEQIIEAFDAGFNEANSIYQNTFSLDYYNQNYNQNK